MLPLQDPQVRLVLLNHVTVRLADAAQDEIHAAGIENELLYEPQTTLLFGDAKDSLAKVLTAVKNI